MKTKLLFITILCGFGFTYAQQTYVPDNNFENYLETHDAAGNIAFGAANSMGNGIANDNYVTTANINTVTSLSVASQSIADLSGIEDFAALQYLTATSNNLTTVDISSNTQLLTINFLFNSLTALDVSSNILLTSIVTHHNNLTSLDISNNPNLGGLDCRVNNITSLDLSNANLTWVHCSDNGMTSLTTGANTSLQTLYCHNNALTSLDFSANTALSTLQTNNNQTTSLNVKNGNNANFTYFNAVNNPGLTCIIVDNATYSTANWPNKDAIANYANSQALCSTLSAEAFEQVDFTMYPNPAKASVSIQLNEKSAYELLSINGQLIKSGQLKVGKNDLNISSISDGIYLMRVLSDQGISVKKLIKQ